MGSRIGDGTTTTRRRAPWWVATGVAVLALGAVGAVLMLRDDEPVAAAADDALPTVPVTRADLSSVTEVDGVLGYEGTSSVLGPEEGRITWLPGVGAVVERGAAVYGVDGHAVPLLYGTTPFWRTLGRGMTSGDDVLELEQNLAALGYAPALTVDRVFTAATGAAIRRWQHDLGVPATAVLAATDAVVLPGPARVTGLTAVLGGPADGTVLTTSGTTRQVTVKLPVSSQETAATGAAVRIELPGGAATTGHIVSVGTVATSERTNAQAQTGEGTESATITVTITLDSPSDAGTLDGAPVTVGFTSVSREDVLAVPVDALLAKADGTYLVNVVDGAGTVREVPVGLGIFDEDRVEVTGDLAEGARVQVPRR